MEFVALLISIAALVVALSVAIARRDDDQRIRAAVSRLSESTLGMIEHLERRHERAEKFIASILDTLIKQSASSAELADAFAGRDAASENLRIATERLAVSAITLERAAREYLDANHAAAHERKIILKTSSDEGEEN